MFATLITFSASNSQAGFKLDIEGGLVSNGYNDVRIPGDIGTDISLTDDLKSDESGFWRLRLGIDLGQRHRLSFLVAPLRLNASGVIDRNIEYNGVSFESVESLSSRYRFDSYRLSYSYRLVQSNHLKFDIGFTAKIRDASIEIKSESQSSEKTNTGFVPLINFSLDWSFVSRFGFLFEGDALAAPQGRAEDVLLAPYVDVSDRLRFRIGYRIPEGGADNDEVYNFTLVHYLSVGLSIKF
ncbi:MAG: hypothetical protein ABIJ12_13450 [bacterium]